MASPNGLVFDHAFHETDSSVSPDSCVSLEARLAFSFLQTVVRPIPRSLAAFDRLPPTCPSTSTRRWSIPLFESVLSDRYPRPVGEFICCLDMSNKGRSGSSTSNIGPWDKMTPRSITLSSSPILPGQG